MSASIQQKHPRIDNRRLRNLSFVMLAAAILLTGAFGIYYYNDRYVYAGDMSPSELAISHLEQAALDHPDSPEVRLSLAQQYLDAGNYPGAIEQAQAVLNAYPDSPAALLLMGVAYTQSEQYALGNQMLERYVKLRLDADEPILDQTLETALYFSGANYNALGDPNKAIETLQRALDIDRTDADALYQLGLAYASTGQHQQAIDAYQKAVLFVPDFTEVYQGMAGSYTALQMGAYVNYAKGMQAYSQKDYPVAQKLLEKAAAELPDFAPAHLGLALTEERLGDVLQAFTHAERVLELDPQNIVAKDMLTRLQ